MLAALLLGWGVAQAGARAAARKSKADAPPAAADTEREQEFAARRLLKRADDLFLAREAERALKILESVIEQYPKSKAVWDAWLAFGKHYVAAADYPKAINALRHLNALKKPDEEPTGRDLEIYLEGLYLTGVAHFHMRQFATAFPILRKITNGYPNTVWANQSYYYIGMCHFAQGNWNKAIEALSLVGTFVDPNSPSIEYAEAGRRFFVKVEDADLPVLFRLGQKPAIALETKNGDKEALDPIALAGEAGIFIASIPTEVAPPKPADGVLQVIGGDTITASYIDSNTQEGKKSVKREKRVRVVSTATLRYTLGTFASKASAAYLGQPLFVLLHDIDHDTTPAADTVAVKLTSRYKRPLDDTPLSEGLASVLEVRGDDEDQYVVRDEVILTLTELPPVDSGQRTVDGGQPAVGGPQSAAGNPKSAIGNPKSEIRSGRFGGSVAVEGAREGQPIDKTDAILTCAMSDQIVATYIDELHIGGEAPRQVTAIIGVIGEIDGRPRATQNVVPDPILRTRKNLVEATAYLELARIFRSMGLMHGAKEKAVEGLDRVDPILRDRSPIPTALREEAFKLKWELHIVQDDFANAIATCQLFNRLYPDSPFVDAALMGIGAVRIENKTYADAIAVYRQVLALPVSRAKAEAQFRIAEATEAVAAMAPVREGAGTKQFEAAIQQYKTCAEKYPDSEFAGQALAKLIDYQIEQRDYARAEDLLEQVFQDYPDSTFLDSMLLKWVLVAYRRGDFAKAQAKCAQLLFEYPASEHAKKAKEILPRIEEKLKATDEKKKEG